MASDDKKAPNLVTIKDEKSHYNGRTIDDNILHQLQNVFCSLELSERTAHDAIDFCFSHKDYAGEPTDVSVQ